MYHYCCCSQGNIQQPFDLTCSSCHVFCVAVAAGVFVVGGGCYADFCCGNDAVCEFGSFVNQLIHLTDRNCDVQGVMHGLSSQPWHSLASRFGRH